MLCPNLKGPEVLQMLWDLTVSTCLTLPYTGSVIMQSPSLGYSVFNNTWFKPPKCVWLPSESIKRLVLWITMGTITICQGWPAATKSRHLTTLDTWGWQWGPLRPVERRLSHFLFLLRAPGSTPVQHWELQERSLPSTPTSPVVGPHGSCPRSWSSALLTGHWSQLRGGGLKGAVGTIEETSFWCHFSRWCSCSRPHPHFNKRI